jgi:hypothetical protein
MRTTGTVKASRGDRATLEMTVRRYSSPFLAGVIVERLRADHDTIGQRISA